MVITGKNSQQNGIFRGPHVLGGKLSGYGGAFKTGKRWEKKALGRARMGLMGPMRLMEVALA